MYYFSIKEINIVVVIRRELIYNLGGGFVFTFPYGGIVLITVGLSSFSANVNVNVNGTYRVYY